MEVPHWIISILPKCVSDERSSSYSESELSKPRIMEPQRKQAKAIIKLSCYYWLLLIPFGKNHIILEKIVAGTFIESYDYCAFP